MTEIYATELTTLFLDLNSYFASVEQQVNPNLRGKPVIVVPTDTDATCAIAASYEAKRFGIKTNTPVYEALSRCPDLKIVVAHHDLYVDFHEKIMTEINQYAPIKKICSIDEAACEIPHHYREVSLAKALAQQIKIAIWKNVGEAINCSIGLASNNLLAKIASDMNKPDGLTVLMPDQIPESIYHLKLRDFPGIGLGMERRFYLKGVFDIKRFCQLSPKQARKIWGSVTGERYWYQLRGMEMAPLKTKRTTVGHSHVLAPILRYPDKARLVARRLTIKAASRLRRMDYYAGRIYLSVRFVDRSKWQGERSLTYVKDNFSLLENMSHLWTIMQEETPYFKNQRIKKVSVGFSSLKKKSHVTHDMFSIPANEIKKYETISDSVDKINKKYGRDSVFIGALPDMKKNRFKKNVTQKHRVDSMGKYSGVKIAFSRIPDREEFYE